MEHGKHKMPNGHMMSDKEMAKIMKNKRMKKKKQMTSDGYMLLRKK